MRGAIALGLRLAGAGVGPARLRTALVVLATCVGTALLLVVGAIANAEQAIDHSMYASSWELRRLLYAVALTVSLPILALVATAGRLSAELRDRRLANLRLLGLSPVQTRAVAVSEAAASAVVGVVLGAVLFQVVRPILTLIHVAGRRWSYATLTPTILWYGVICAVVLLGVVAIGVLPQRTQMSSALARARKADARRPSWWRTVPLLAGAAICAQQLIRSGQETSDVEWVLFVGAPLLAIGLLLLVPVLVRLLADALLRSATSPVALVAARRMQAQPAAVSRVVSALLIGLFVVTGARAVVGVFEAGTTQAVRQLTVQQRVELAATPKTLPTTMARAAHLRGVQRVLALPMLTTSCRRFQWCGTAVVASCAQLHVMAPELTGCVDGQPMWLEDEPRTNLKGRALDWHAQFDSAPFRSPSVVVSTPVPTRAVAGDSWGQLNPIEASVLLPPALLKGTALPPRATVDLLVLGQPGRTLADRLAGAGLEPQSTADFGDYDYVAGLRAIVWAVAAVLLSVGLLAFAVAAIDRAVNRRREVVSLQLIGIPAGVLRRAQWVEAALPIGLGTVLAIGAGLLAGAAYLAYGDANAEFPWHAAETLTLISLGGAAAIAALTVLAASPKIRPELIRVE